MKSTKKGSHRGTKYSVSQIERNLEKAMNLVQQGKLRQAETAYREVLTYSPGNVEAIHLLGVIALQTHRAARAVEFFRQAITLDESVRSYHNNLGQALHEVGKHEEAVISFEKAIDIDPNYATAYFNRGIALRTLGQFDKALASYDKALALDPHDAEAHNNRGLVLEELGRLNESLTSYDKAVQQRQDFSEAHCNRGNVLKRTGMLFKALDSYDRAIFLRPDSAEAHCGRGIVLAEIKRFDDALLSYDRAIRLKSTYADAHFNRGIALQSLLRFEDALQSFQRAIQIKPDFSKAWFNLGNICFEMNQGAEAIKALDKAAELEPKDSFARFGSCLAELPILYRTEEDIVKSRETYARKLRRLCEDYDAGLLTGDLAGAIATRPPFLLAYQGYCDRELQRTYGSLACEITRRAFEAPTLPGPPASGEPVRVGFVSSFFFNHSNWKIPIKGWMSQLDRRRFRIFGYQLGDVSDAETEEAAALCDRFARGLRTVADGRGAILADAPHVLIYPGLFMDRLSQQLAAERLAPVQCNSLGHPETSGMPTVDYFLSSDLMEPPDASAHYTEQLVRLPNLSIYYTPTPVTKLIRSREDFGLRPAATIFWCGQSLFKFLPQFDGVFAEIAARVENCQFVFLQYPDSQNVTEDFKQRLDRAFYAKGLNHVDHCVVLPRLNYAEFIAAIGQCDVVLDSIGWSGFNSTLESREFDLPIVAFQGSLMRGRHSAAILRRMGIPDMIATTIDDYVSIAVNLANNPEKRASMSRRFAENKHKLYREKSCVEALEDFLDRVGRNRELPTSYPLPKVSSKE